MSSDPLSIEALCADLDVPDYVLRFEHIPGGEVVFGPGTLERIGEKAAAAGARHVLIVTDPGIEQTGHPARAERSLRNAGLEVSIFSEVHENPTTDDVERCVARARDAGIDMLVGLGGGSSMDTAKGCNFILSNGGEMKDYQGVDRATRPMLPLIAVPTTSGTGSECQSFALIADARTHAKMACGDKKAAALLAILDPELTLTQPRKVTAHTGIDAIAHALETAVCKKRTAESLAYSKAAWHLLERGFEKVLSDPQDLKARARAQLGAAFAGVAIENSMLGIAHSCANPLTAHYGTVHGQAVGTMMPWVVEFNRQDPEANAIYDELYPAGLENRLNDILKAAEMDKSVSGVGAQEADLDQLGVEAASQWTAQFNPVPVDAESLASLYRKAW